MDSLGLALANTLAFLKLLTLRWNRRIFHNILTAMERDWSNCGSCESIMMTVKSLSRHYSIVLIGVHALAAFFLSVAAYVFRALSASDDFRELPVKMEFSFEVTKSPLFECLLIGQFLYELSLASVAGMINALLATLVLHVGGQIDIMRQAIIEMSSSTSPDISLTVIRNLIHKHRKIITLSEDIENLFSSISLMQLLWNTLIICCAGFMIIITLSHKSTAGLIKSVLLYVAKTLEVFVFCYAGEYLSAKSRSISDAIYESLWFNMEPSNSRVLLFIMVRSQKRLTITAGKIFDLTLEGFMSVMKTSASYMSVLHAMY
nr:PREDICTED: odorant receptor 82a-like [Linepithema humile]